jgi:N-acyl-phosphatidylethanolamine-hydrolysing phospholipase D
VITILRRLARDRDAEARERSAWYRDGAYVNFEHDPGAAYRRFGSFVRWRVSRPEPPVHADAPDVPPGMRPLSPDALSRPARGIKVAWLGHATIYIATPRAAFVTDPVFGAPPLVRRVTPLPIAPDRLPPADALLVSHNHFDHVSPASTRALRERSPRMRAIVPSGLEGWTRRRLGFAEARALEWWERAEVDGASVTAVPAHHWSRRGLGDANQSHWCGFLVEADGKRLLFAGDTAISRHVDAIAARFAPVDVAVLPIGSYSPRWFMRSVHMDPAEAVATARALRAGVVLPIHWGTFRMTDEPLGEPPLYLERAAETARQPIRLWRPGDVHEA